MIAVVYTKKQCPYCDQAKMLLSAKDVDYTEVVIGEDMLREDFISLFPEQKTVPLIIMNGVKYGGFDKLREHFAGQ
jgi:glutaredoxin 3